MNYYNQQGPAQYAQGQQSRRDRQMSNLLQMMMQMKQFKQRQGQWEQEQEVAQSKQEWLEKYQQGTMDYQKFLMNPEMQAAMAKRKAEGKAKGEPPEIPKPRPILPNKIKRFLIQRHGYTNEQLNNLDDVSMRNLVNQYELETKPEKPAKPPAGKQQFEKDYTRIKSLLGRYDKEKTRYLAQIKNLPEIDPSADLSTQQKVNTTRLKVKTGMINLETATALLIKMQDATANGTPLSDDEQRQFSRLLNINKVKQDGVIPAADVPPGTPTASNKAGEQVALIENKWIPILA